MIKSINVDHPYVVDYLEIYVLHLLELILEKLIPKLKYSKT